MRQARRFMFKDTRTEEVMVLPVTPSGYKIDHGGKVIQVDAHSLGTINLPGEPILLDQVLECLLPAHEYPFNQPETVTDPFMYIERLERWSDEGTPVRFVVSDTPVNALVLIDPIEYREQDGTRDVYVSIPLRGYKLLTAPETELNQTGNENRAVETEPVRATTYVVKKGDTLSAISKWVYGDASLYVRLAAANDIANPNRIRVGQVLTLPDVDALPAARSTATYSEVVAEAVETEQSDEGYWNIRLSKEAAMEPAGALAKGVFVHPRKTWTKNGQLHTKTGG